ncbi:hypothetical protein [Octadecabacter sp. R77987]|uniref:hypothetical protein n=1 Tax=Octadecabacter sp. R77987 TaxID=3093874 RepID=UPI00366ACA72
MTLSISNALAIFLLTIFVLWIAGSVRDYVKGRRMRKFHNAQRLAAKLEKGQPSHNPRGRRWRK